MIHYRYGIVFYGCAEQYIYSTVCMVQYSLHGTVLELFLQLRSVCQWASGCTTAPIAAVCVNVARSYVNVARFVLCQFGELWPVAGVRCFPRTVQLPPYFFVSRSVTFSLVTDFLVFSSPYDFSISRVCFVYKWSKRYIYVLGRCALSRVGKGWGYTCRGAGRVFGSMANKHR